MDESASSFIASGWLYGSIVGILLFGYIGDTLGYYKGMIVATVMTFVGIILGYARQLEFDVDSCRSFSLLPPFPSCMDSLASLWVLGVVAAFPLHTRERLEARTPRSAYLKRARFCCCCRARAGYWDPFCSMLLFACATVGF